MRVSFGLTFDHHGVFGINNMLLHRLFYYGWGLSDCSETDTVLNGNWWWKQKELQVTGSPSRGTSKAQTLWHSSSSSSSGGTTSVLILHGHGIWQGNKSWCKCVEAVLECKNPHAFIEVEKGNKFEWSLLAWSCYFIKTSDDSPALTVLHQHRLNFSLIVLLIMSHVSVIKS